MMRVRTILGILLLVSLSGTSLAQMHMPKTGSSPSMGARGQMMGQGNMQMMQMMAMMQTMHPAIAVDDTSVYVVRGDQIVKLDKNNLQAVATGTLPPLPASDMHMMGGMQGTSTATPGAIGGVGGSTTMHHPDMQGMMDRMSQSPSDQFDKMFLQNMIHHHAGGIAMSRLAVKKATHPELRRFAQSIIDTQSRQNKQFSIWLKNWYQTSTQPMAMPMDEDMLNRLRGYRGHDFEIQFLQMMIRHHQDAVHMSEMAQQKAAHPELKTAASKIVSSQTAEIAKMRNWLSAWYRIAQ